MEYNENYYKSLNYTDYLSRGNRYRKLCKEIIELLRSTFLIHEPMLDYGCAVGFFLEALIENKFKAYGYDISEWAISECKEKNLPVMDELSRVGTMFALDVFEHMSLSDISEALHKCRPELLICRIPVSNDGGKSFVLDISNKDPTHVTRLSKNSWEKFLKQMNYEILFHLNLCTIYDTEGVFCFVARRG